MLNNSAHCHLSYLDLQLLIESVVNPQVDVASPVSLLLDGGYVGYGSLIHFSNRVRIGVTLHQPQVIKPGIVVVWVCLYSRKLCK